MTYHFPNMKTSPRPIDALIRTLRGQKVILDSDLADLYGVPTKVFNQAVKRNLDRFPEDFMFHLTHQEWDALRSQIVTSKLEPMDSSPINRSQSVTGSQKHRGSRFLPHAFTEHGAIMAATVLSSPQAVSMSVYVVRAFVQMREQISANMAVLQRLAEIDRTLLDHDGALRKLWAQLKPLLTPPPDTKTSRIGFHAEHADGKEPTP